MAAELRARTFAVTVPLIAGNEPMVTELPTVTVPEMGSDALKPALLIAFMLIGKG